MLLCDSPQHGMTELLICAMSAASAVQYAYTHARHMHYVQLRHKDQEIKEIVVNFAAVSLTHCHVL